MLKKLKVKSTIVAKHPVFEDKRDKCLQNDKSSVCQNRKKNDCRSWEEFPISEDYYSKDDDLARLEKPRQIQLDNSSHSMISEDEIGYPWRLENELGGANCTIVHYEAQCDECPCNFSRFRNALIPISSAFLQYDFLAIGSAQQDELAPALPAKAAGAWITTDLKRDEMTHERQIWDKTKWPTKQFEVTYWFLCCILR